MKVRSPSRNPTRQLTRRTFVAQCAAAATSATALSAVPDLAGAASPVSFQKALTTHLAPVVSFHIDRPYIDRTGMAMPYLPPVGTRSGQPLADLSEEEYLRHHVYL